MTSSSERSTSLFASSSAGRRILSRFASPFAQKSRSISEFTVNADDPHKQHSPGEKVTGHIILRIVKPIRVTHISVCLHGFVQVYKTPGLPPADGNRGNSTRIGRAQGKKSGEYWGNGFASLFEDEVVLCGEGRLAEGSYRFNFEVAFPEDIVLPSSIDFERGAINYMVTGTLTRPTTISPVVSYDLKLFYVERIDIARLLPPKSRTITLEPVTKKARTKTKRVVNPDGKLALSTASTVTHDSLASSAPNAPADQELPRTPSISETSLHSRISSNGGKSASEVTHPSQRTSGSFVDVKGPGGDKTITATVESLKGGCLRGDIVPVKISITHTKHIKSMNGVIVTLYRLSRVDMHPALPLGPAKDGQNRKYEDYYPKSLTGLGGLSLSGAGSSHVFRKDLAQTLVPLIVDPHTLSADITAKIRVPEDIFPTITTVPGQMIDFKYYVEVVLDIQGKLAGLDRYVSQQSGNGLYGNHLGVQEQESYPGGERSPLFTQYGAGILDTAPIRREKSVVTCVFEIILGTLDTARHKGKAKARPRSMDDTVIDTSQYAPATTVAQEATQPVDQGHGYDMTTESGWSNAEYLDYRHPVQEFGMDEYGMENGYEERTDGLYYDPSHFRPPQLEDEQELTEKERLRRAEARLMPSQPPDMADHYPQDLADPSAPVLPQDERYIHVIEPALAGPSHTTSATVPWPGHTHDAHTWTPSDVPDHHDYLASYENELAQSSHNDDKQEIQRRQLQLAASAPAAEDLAQDVAGEGSSAPAIVEDLNDHDHDENEHRSNFLHAEVQGENLPRYQR